MGTEVLYPHDILASRRLGSAPSTTAAFPRQRRLTPNPNPNPNARPNRKQDARKRREGSPGSVAAAAKNCGGGNRENSNLVMGQVTILRRGESLDSDVGKGLQRKARKEERRGGEGTAAAVISSEARGELIVFGTGWLGPEPAAVPKQTRLKDVRTGAKGGWVQAYAGPAFSMSPSPTALPLPTFSSRKLVESGGDAVDQSATRDLRRLLRLD